MSPTISSFIKGSREVPGGPVVRALHLHYGGLGGGVGSILGRGTKIPHVTQRGLKLKQIKGTSFHVSF